MKNKITTIVSFMIILIVWKVVSLQVNRLFVPDPLKVFEDGKTLFTTGQLQIAMLYTFRRIAIASCLAGIVALPIGLLIYNFPIFRYSLNPIISLFRYVPVTAFYPLLIMWLGIDEKMKIAFLFIAAFVYMMPSVVITLEDINQDLIDTGYTIGMNKFQVITRIQLPAMLPSIMNSFIMCFGIGFTYCAVVETINAKYGIGYMIQQASARGKTDLVFLGILVIMVISFLFDNIAKFIVRKIFKWRYINDSN